MGFFVLLLNKEMSSAESVRLLGHLFAIDPTSVADVRSEAIRELYYEVRLLQRAKTPRSADPAAVFFVEWNIYPPGHLQALYESDYAFARAFCQQSQLPVLLSMQDLRDPYRWVLFDGEQAYEVDERPEDEATVAITVTAENKILLTAPYLLLGQHFH